MAMMKTAVSFGIFGLVVFLAVGCSNEATAIAPITCYPAPASFISGREELRFPKPGGPRGGPLCYDIVLRDSRTPYIYPPLENKSGNALINLITPGEIEIYVKDGHGPLGDGGPYRWTETADSLRRNKYRNWNPKEKCAIFSIRGRGTARVIVDRYERMERVELGGIERSTHCPGMY
jgi:hypothetical protein